MSGKYHQWVTTVTTSAILGLCTQRFFSHWA